MSNGMNLLLLGELAREKSLANQEAGFAAKRHQKEIEEHHKFVFSARSHVHSLRAVDHAHVRTEELLIAALKAENPNHPLASKEAVEAFFEVERVKALVNPEIIKRTFPSGKLPEGTIGGSPLDGRRIDRIN